LELKHFTSDLSTIERQAIARIAIKAIIDSPIVFNFPDSIADFELGQLYRPDSNLIIDNTHNFWFDFALIYGAPVAIISLVITSLCAMIYILKKFESCNSRANDLFKVTLLLNLYILSFFTIFHPITVLIYGCLFGCFVKELGPYLSQVSQNIRLVKPLLSLEYAKLKFAFFLPKNFLYNWFTSNFFLDFKCQF
jgi:hypothetical protein